MISSKVLLAAASASALAMGVTTALAAPAAPASSNAVMQDMPPLSAYGELPSIEDAAISPSGQFFAALVTVDGKRLLVAFDQNNKPISSTNVDTMKVRSFEWVGDDRLLLTYSITENLGYSFTTDKHEFDVATIIPMNNSLNGKVVFSNRQGLVNAVFGNYGIRKIDGRWYGFFGALELARGTRNEYVFKHGRPYLYRVDLQDYTTKRIALAADDGQRSDWLVDARGEVAVSYEFDRERGDWFIRNADGDKIAQGKSPEGRIGLVGLGSGGQSVIYSLGSSGEGSSWLEVPLSGGTSKPFLEDVDVERVFFDRATGYYTGYLPEGDDSKPVFANPAHGDAVTKVRQAFKDYDLRMVNWSNDLSKMVVRTTGVKDSGTWFSVDVENLAAKAFGYERMAVEPRHVGPFSTFEYTASDGMEMDGILTLPPGREPTNLPLVMMPHGGPHSSDKERFDWWAQAFASRGYAVFQPNFRGSTNRDYDFRRAGYGEWGRKMQTDKSDGLAALAEAGIIDPNRACIVGASYGGYAALAGVTLQQGIYKCAVAVAPVSDIRRMYDEDYKASGKRKVTRTVMLERLGDPDGWNNVSPERHAANADAPIMLIHGKDDTVVPFVHSFKMADALKDEGKPYEMITLEGEDHWLSLSETRHKMLAASVGFVQKHNPAD